VLTLACLVAAATMLLNVMAATGAESRKDFVSKVDPICKAKQRQAAAILEKAPDGNQARGKAWATIARKGRAALADIYRIGAAPADLVIFDRWVQKIQGENTLVVRMARALKAGQPKNAAVFRQKATDENKRAEKVVRDFGFKYCDRSTLGTP
jgi:hypothetical protein